MTAWPSGKPDNDFLPMMGGYPDAPWTMGKRHSNQTIVLQ